MKKNIHPELFEVTAHCTCGNQFVTSSTQEELRTTLCSACHPFILDNKNLLIQQEELKNSNNVIIMLERKRHNIYIVSDLNEYC